MHPSIASKYIGAMATCGHFSALGVNQATEVRSFWSMNMRIYCLSPLSKSYHALGLVRKDAVNFYICIVFRMIVIVYNWYNDYADVILTYWSREHRLPFCRWNYPINFLAKNCCKIIQISLWFVPTGPVGSKPAGHCLAFHIRSYMI